MTEEPPRQLRLAGLARRDITAILKRSLSEFGEEAYLRYNVLIGQVQNNAPKSDPASGRIPSR